MASDRTSRFPQAPAAPVQIHQHRSGAPGSLLIASAHASATLQRDNLGSNNQLQSFSISQVPINRLRQPPPVSAENVPEPESLESEIESVPGLEPDLESITGTSISSHPATPTRRPSPSIYSEVTSNSDTLVKRLRMPLGTNWTEGHLDPSYIQGNYDSSSEPPNGGHNDFDITVPSELDVGLKMTPKRRAAIVKLVDQSLSYTEKGADGISLAVGTAAKVKEVINDFRAHCTSSIRLNMITVRELITLLFTNLGYHRFPVGAGKSEPTYQDFVYTFSCTHKNFLPFLRKPENTTAIRAQAHLSNRTQVGYLLKILEYGYDLFNLMVHDINIGRAIEVINWLKCSPPGPTFKAFDWPTQDAEREMPVFIKALEGLFPPVVAIAYGNNDLEALNKYQSGSLSEYVKQHGCTQTRQGRTMKPSARAYAETIVNRKKEGFFREAAQKGWMPSTREMKATRSELTTTRSELTSTRSDLTTTRSELTSTRSDLTTTMAKLTTTENTLAANITTVDATIKRLLNENQNLRNSQAEMMNENQDLRNSQAEMMNENQNLRNSQAAMELNIQYLFDQLKLTPTSSNQARVSH